MRDTSNSPPDTVWGRFTDALEENLMAALLGMMVVLTFVNVIRRYVFNSSLIWSLEVVLMMFSALVILGISYGVKKTTHLGVDALLNIVSAGPRRVMTLISAFCCLVYATLMMKGAWDYWAPFASLNATSGRWLPTGFEATRTRSFMETDQVPMPSILNFLSDLINDGEAYSKLPDVVPYTVLPIGAALLLFRFVQATVRIARGQQTTLIVSHEAEEAVESAAIRTKDS